MLPSLWPDMWGSRVRSCMFVPLLLFLPVMVDAWTNEQWAATINKAGLQRTLSQQMTKEFLLISRGTKVSEFRAKLVQGMSNFNTTLHALMVGDLSQDILPAPDHRVVAALQDVELIWVPMEKLLRENMDTVRRADGSYDMVVLEELNSLNVPLLDTSDAVVKALVDSAQVSGASTNGLVQDIAGRQRTLIQRLAKGILFLSQGVAMTFNMKAYSNTKILFETSHDGIIQGVPFAGLPVLTSLCTIHQMREVSFYYEQLRPLLTGITNADTPSTSQKAADAVAEEVVDLVDPLFSAMVEAVKLFGHEGSCNPAAQMTDSEWHAFFMTLANQRVLTKRTMQYFTQVGLKVDVKSSQVEITVRLSQASGNLRDLIEGNKIKGIPAPPSQAIVDALLSVDATWNTFESELEAAVHLESVSEIIMARVDLLGERILHTLESVMHMGLDMVTNTTIPAYVIDTSFEQVLLASEMMQSAVLLNFGQDVTSNWDSLNASRASYTSHMWKLLEGEPGKSDRVTNVCLVQQVKRANDLYSRFEQAALSVGHGNSGALTDLVLLSPLALQALEVSAESLSTGNGSCGNGSLLADEWIQLHREAAVMASLSQEITGEYILLKQGERHNSQRLDLLVEDLDASLRRIMFGSFEPPIAAPSSQEKFDHMLGHLAPAVTNLKQAISGIDITAVLNAEHQLMLDAETLQDQYLTGATTMDAQWPGKRVDVARRQVTLAQKVFTEAALFAYDLRSSDAELNAAVGNFEEAHLQLRDGGGGLSGIMLPERQDLLTQWEQVDGAWQQVRGYLRQEPISRLESAMLQLVAELTKIIPLYAIEDVKDPDAFPWPILAYSIIGFFILTCCSVMVMCALSSRRRKTPACGAASGVAKSAMDEV